MKKKILLLGNSAAGFINFRKELLEELVYRGFEVIVVCPIDNQNQKIKELKDLGCIHIELNMNRRGINPLEELRLIYQYFNIVRKIKPFLILSYTIKPNIYGSIIARLFKITIFSNVTGLGTAINESSLIQKVVLNLYKFSFKKTEKVFFQNQKNLELFINKRIIKNNYVLLPGSGVNLDFFQYKSYPEQFNEINFVFVARLMKEKGVEEFLEAAKHIKSLYPNVYFHVCGTMEEDYAMIVSEFHKKGIIIYHGIVSDIQSVYKKSHSTIHPSYHEGMSNVLLETAATGRPVIASDIPGCRETFDEGISGIGFIPRNTESLINAIEKFIQLDNNTRKQMGLSGRKKMEKEFDRQIVVDKYLREIESI